MPLYIEGREALPSLTERKFHAQEEEKRGTKSL